MARRLAASGAALAVAVALGGCFGEEPRDRVESYLEQVNAAQASIGGLDRAASIYRRVTGGDGEISKARPRLVKAEAAIASLTEKLTAIEPPAEADRLHDLLTRFYRLNAALAAETAGFATFVPAAESALEPLAKANRQMSAGLRTPDAAAQARTLARFSAAVGTVLSRLRKLEPPPLLVRVHRSRIKGLGAVKALASRLRAALRRQDADAVGRLLVRFGRTNSTTLSGGLDRRSVREYRRRYRELTNVGRQIRQEQSDLRRQVVTD